MNKNKKDAGQKVAEKGEDLLEKIWNESWTYIKTVVNVVREPILILDENLRVMAANDSFYRTFQVESKDTEKKNVYELGNGQWNIPALRKLLEDILPKNTFFKGFEVSHQFPFIGQKVMILNAREIHFKDDDVSEIFPPIILLAMEDDDIETVLATAKNIRMPHRRGSFNPLSSLPEPKAKIKQAIKERIRLLAGAYISLAGFVDDEDIRFAEDNPKSKKTRAIYLKVLEDMETATKEIRGFKVFDSSV